MDGFDLYYKLSYGTSFGPSKKRKRKKPKCRRKPKAKVASVSDTNVENSEGESEVDEPNTDVSRENVNQNRDDGIGEDNTITLMTNNGESVPKKKKKEKEPMGIMKLTKIRREEITHFRRQQRIYVVGDDVPDPIKNFDELKSDYNLHSSVLSNISKFGYTTPTPVQMQVIPLLIDERQVFASAPTGSGKTASFLIPIIHNLKAPQNVGIRALILVPTRELAKQIHQNCLKLAEGTHLRPCIIDNVNTVSNDFEKFATENDILISTPNRLVHMVQQDPPLISFNEVQWFIVDESDKLFETGEHGFRDQLAIIYAACDSTRVKISMFSATYSQRVEDWCKTNFNGVVSVTIGVRNTAVESVQQELKFVGWEEGKLLEFRYMIQRGLRTPALIFVQSIKRADELFKELIFDNIRVGVIHSQFTQLQRDDILSNFNAGKIWVLICTELMARGIDFKYVDLVINYDFPPTPVSYINRIGRTGRAGRKGYAVTFFTEDDRDNLRSIAQVIKNAGCQVPEYIFKLKKKPKRKNVTALPIKRKKISTTPQYVIDKEAKKKKIIQNSKKRKFQRKKKAQQEKEKNVTVQQS